MKRPSGLLEKLQGTSDEGEIYSIIRLHYHGIMDENEELRFLSDSAKAFTTSKGFTK